MRPVFCLIVALALGGCAGVRPAADAGSPCAVSESSYACQVQRYHDVSQ